MLAKYFRISGLSEEETQRLKHNLLMHLGDGAAFAFAMSFISPTTIMPVFIERVGGSAIAIGAIPILWTMGGNFPQYFLGQQKQNETLVKSRMLRFVIFHRTSFLLVGLFVFFCFGHISSGFSVPIALFSLLGIAILGSVPGPRWVNYFSKTTPTKLRGRLLALRLIFSSILGMVAGSIIIIILSNFFYPHNFAILFFICFFFMFVSYIFLRSVVEPEDVANELAFPVKANKIEKAKSLIKGNKHLRDYLIADSLLLASLTSAAFFAVYALKKFNLPVSYAGSFTIILMGGMALGNIIFGYVGDIFGHKVNLTIMAVSLFLANFTAIISVNPLTYGMVFFFVAFAQGLQGVSRLTYIVELTGETNTTLYASLLNSTTAPTAIFGIIAGVLISTIGYPEVFGIYALISVFAIYWVYKKLADPRRMMTERRTNK